MMALLQSRLALYAVAVALVFGSGWAVKGRLDDTTIAKLKLAQAVELKVISDTATAAAAAAQAKETAMQSQIAKIDQQRTKELQNAQSQNDTLRRDLAAGTRRVFVRADCTASSSGVSNTAGTTGVDHGSATAELDPATAAAMVRIANDGDDAIRALTALQDYVRVTLKP